MLPSSEVKKLFSPHLVNVVFLTPNVWTVCPPASFQQPIVTTRTVLTFYYKFITGKLPVDLQNLSFYPNRFCHGFNTRTFDDIHINRIKHEFAKRCIRYDIPLTVNNTNKIVTHSLHGFSCYVKKHLLQNYKNLCSVPN